MLSLLVCSSSSTTIFPFFTSTPHFPPLPSSSLPQVGHYLYKYLDAQDGLSDAKVAWAPFEKIALEMGWNKQSAVQVCI